MNRLLVVLLLFVGCNPPATETGTCERVLDGDTFVYRPPSGDAFHVRLLGIDAPEKPQRFGPEATALLTRLLNDAELELLIDSDDRYGRKLATVIADGIDVNAHLVEQGLAWHYVKYSDDANLQSLQNEAREASRGLWADARRIAPWDYRNGQRIPSSLPKELDSIRDSDAVVFITRSGTKYHSAGCRHLTDSAREIPLSRAVSAYEPCGTCKP
ncbi:thermonuclease family protein [Rhodopirellula halodulae]|uniref:thermonuclease family protein n=1 Tax=Rhodopirellula halodulae TaxID=2894198 RepID=UPI001E45108D|nr:thermonuclease family protein [Rhodopirellula sp. JC737]MCC9655603.1 thermonuclease family protein [Rhodopirellula sp. JC737]